MTPTRWPRWAQFLAIGALAFAVRAWAVHGYMSTNPVADAAEYHRLGVSLSEGHGYVRSEGVPTAVRSPGYPAFLAGVYTITGPNIRAAGWVQAALGVVTVFIIMWLARLFLGEGLSVVAGFAAAVYPSFFWLSRVTLSENLALPLLLVTLGVAVLVLRNRRRRWLWSGILGGLLCLGTYVRNANLPLSVLLLVALSIVLLRTHRRLSTLGPLLFSALILFVGVLPWGMRNRRQFGHFVFATQDGISLYTAYFPPRAPSGKPNWNVVGDDDPAVAAIHKTYANEVEASRAFTRLTLERLRSHPGLFFSLIPAKMESLLAPYDWDTFPHEGRPHGLNLGYILAAVCAFIGVFRLLRKPLQDGWVLFFLPSYIVLQSVLFLGSPRYRLPAEVSALLLGAYGLGWVAELLSGRRERLPDRAMTKEV